MTAHPFLEVRASGNRGLGLFAKLASTRIEYVCVRISSWSARSSRPTEHAISWPQGAVTCISTATPAMSLVVPSSPGIPSHAPPLSISTSPSWPFSRLLSPLPMPLKDDELDARLRKVALQAYRAVHGNSYARVSTHSSWSLGGGEGSRANEPLLGNRANTLLLFERRPTRPLLVTVQRIEAGVELTVHYGCSYQLRLTRTKNGSTRSRHPRTPGRRRKPPRCCVHAFSLMTRHAQALHTLAFGRRFAAALKRAAMWPFFIKRRQVDVWFTGPL